MEDIKENGVVYRICCGCRRKLELNSDNFHHNKNKRDGFEYRCKRCTKYKTQEWYRNNVDEDKKEIRNKSAKKSREKRVEKGLCKQCTNKAIPCKKVCEYHWLRDMARRHLGSESKWKLLQDLFEKQNGLCVYTKEPLVMGVNASIDHILPLSSNPQTYHDINNLQWVLYDVNLMKRDLSEEKFFNIIEKIYKNKIEVSQEFTPMESTRTCE